MISAEEWGWDLVIWRHFRIEVPSSWEMLRYSRKMEGGRCSFADRYQIRLEMNWRRVPGAPDTARMLSDYESRLTEQGVEELERIQQLEWEGFVGREDNQTVSRFGCYFALESCLLEIVCRWPAARNQEVERRIVASVAEVPAQDGTRRWRAFGMDLAVPEGLELHDCRQQAARAEFSFRAARGVDEYRFMRLGMVPTWLDRPVRTWLTTQVPPGVQIDEEKARTVDGDEIAQVTGRAKRWCRGLRLRRPVYEARAGVDRSDARLYFVSRQGATPGGDLELPRCMEPRLVAAGTGAGASPPEDGAAEPWVAMLAARPRRNEAARVEANENGSVVLSVKRTSRKNLRWPLSWIVPVRAEGRTALDGIGRLIWELCDGARTIEEIIDAFAARHDLTFHESRVSVTDYVKELIRRGILAIEVSPIESECA
ncbi:MAG: PqqD family protein [Verrucomicrobia bacterium]|nr:PqqD family protein [Verrucomicrobiota bacterium]MDA1085677.1 PqqD family protein [Verrucomicrobiota bacterium]